MSRWNLKIVHHNLPTFGSSLSSVSSFSEVWFREGSWHTLIDHSLSSSNFVDFLSSWFSRSSNKFRRSDSSARRSSWEEYLPGACTSASERNTTLLSTRCRLISSPLSLSACAAKVFLIKTSSSKDFKPTSDFPIRFRQLVLPRNTELQASRKSKENFLKGSQYPQSRQSVVQPYHHFDSNFNCQLVKSARETIRHTCWPDSAIWRWSQQITSGAPCVVSFLRIYNSVFLRSLVNLHISVVFLFKF